MYEREHQPLNNMGPGATGNLHVINNLRPEKDTVNLELAKLGIKRHFIRNKCM